MRKTAINTKRVIIIIVYIMFVIFSLIFLLKHQSFAATEKTLNDHTTGGKLVQEMAARKDLIHVVLVGVTEYELTELFNDILENTPGVVETKRIRFQLTPERPQACRVEWRVRIKDIDAFKLESDLYRSIRDIAGTDETAEEPKLSISPTPALKELLGKIRPRQASNQLIRFRFLHLNLKNVNKEFMERSRFRHWSDTGFE